MRVLIDQALTVDGPARVLHLARHAGDTTRRRSSCLCRASRPSPSSRDGRHGFRPTGRATSSTAWYGGDRARCSARDSCLGHMNAPARAGRRPSGPVLAHDQGLSASSLR
jgi:hypothetical protein